MSSPNNTQSRRQVLLVDGEPDFLQSARDAFAALSGGQWEIHGAAGAESALDQLNKHKMDLLLVDTDIPLLDGIQFLNLMGQRYPGLKKVSLSKGGTDGKRTACLAAGAELFIEKPRSPDGFKSVHAMLEDLLAWTPEQGFQGLGRRVGLQDVIQMECLGHNSSVLEVYNNDVLGRIYIENGNIVHAAGGDLMGEKALQRLLTLPDGSFELAPFEEPLQRTISGPWEAVLVDAARPRNDAAGPVAGVDPKTLVAAKKPGGVRITETLICSDKGQPIYEADCADVPGRVQWLSAVARHGAKLAEIAPLGNFDRLEMQLPDGRIIAQARPDRLVFVAVDHNHQPRR